MPFFKLRHEINCDDVGTHFSRLSNKKEQKKRTQMQMKHSLYVVRMKHGRGWMNLKREREKKLTKLFDGFWMPRIFLIDLSDGAMQWKRSHYFMHTNHIRGNCFHQNNNKIINNWADDTFGCLNGYLAGVSFSHSLVLSCAKKEEERRTSTTEHQFKYVQPHFFFRRFCLFHFVIDPSCSINIDMRAYTLNRPSVRPFEFLQ